MPPAIVNAFWTGHLTKRLQAGQAASAGVFSAALAQTGFTGAHNIFNGRFGFLTPTMDTPRGVGL